MELVLLNNSIIVFNHFYLLRTGNRYFSGVAILSGWIEELSQQAREMECHTSNNDYCRGFLLVVEPSDIMT